ncbi:hypothetical protein RIF29_18603 [Crotalaria pallida]|uniref:Uncharacterized protein n=1 Tax=Crotalaria pallida TaxID=3830 RepID=A0AAN9EXY4_CROPI
MSSKINAWHGLQGVFLTIGTSSSGTPLDVKLLNGLRLGLEGDHQYLNAGLAIALCSTWLKKTGHLEDTTCLEPLGRFNVVPSTYGSTSEDILFTTFYRRSNMADKQFLQVVHDGNFFPPSQKLPTATKNISKLHAPCQSLQQIQTLGCKASNCDSEDALQSVYYRDGYTMEMIV